jgi:hypothetical protein
MRTLPFLLAISWCHLVLAQVVPNHQLSAGFIGEFRLGSNSYNIRNRPGVSMAYGLRAYRLFQLDAGVEYIPRPVGASACCRYVDNANDSLFLAPIGGRLVLGPRDGRWAFGFGGGGAYMNHHVGNKAPDVTPGASGGGWYALVSGNASLGQASHLRLGGTLRWYRFGLDGFSPGRFLTVGPELTWLF